MTIQAACLPRKSVLYVEDHPVNVMLMSALFEFRPELELVVATDGQQAMRIAANLQPALMLLDLRLPDCQGNELLPLLRRLRGCASAPAVAVTAEDCFEIEGSGFVELWAKPLNLAWVLQRLEVLTADPHHAPAMPPPQVLAPALYASASTAGARSARPAAAW